MVTKTKCWYHFLARQLWKRRHGRFFQILNFPVLLFLLLSKFLRFSKHHEQSGNPRWRLFLNYDVIPTYLLLHTSTETLQVLILLELRRETKKAQTEYLLDYRKWYFIGESRLYILLRKFLLELWDSNEIIVSFFKICPVLLKYKLHLVICLRHIGHRKIRSLFIF